MKLLKFSLAVEGLAVNADGTLAWLQGKPRCISAFHSSSLVPRTIGYSWCDLTWFALFKLNLADLNREVNKHLASWLCERWLRDIKRCPVVFCLICRGGPSIFWLLVEIPWTTINLNNLNTSKRGFPRSSHLYFPYSPSKKGSWPSPRGNPFLPIPIQGPKRIDQKEISKTKQGFGRLHLALPREPLYPVLRTQVIQEGPHWRWDSSQYETATKDRNISQAVQERGSFHLVLKCVLDCLRLGGPFPTTWAVS